ncbi:GEVED domain-containing protein [Nonlabens dokdonensis]|uniref:Cell surface calcium-binding acidic-repeat protein n=2 Tax=Nonlabens dokdonensis TaxID=328515 RepID=L7WHZ5_NONDD|nr:GEVED domain-containing protein [Nonlabens dokdonensis]AGC78628.1 cell surface calcium-binding acidic-repeat protein [Nonlabens dokdonensis DSW-6]
MKPNYLNSNKPFLFGLKSINSIVGKILILFLLGISGSLFAQTYCTPNISYNNDQFIDRVRLNNLDNSSGYTGNAQGYHDYTAQTANLEIGSNYTLTLDIYHEFNWLRAGIVGWIDFNSDGTFNNNTEKVISLDDTNAAVRTATISIPTTVSPGTYRMRFIMKSWYEVGDACASDTDWYGETEDYTVVISSPSSPIANNDYLNVLFNSLGGAGNSIDVSLNDLIGSTYGSDGDDYSIASYPLTTANGGTVTEVSDGLFNYVPLTDFIGVDSFSYQLCDAGGVCTTAVVEVAVGFGACTPTSNSSGTHYLDSVLLNGESGSQINNNSGDDNGFGNYTNLTAVQVYAGGTYTLTPDAVGANSGWAAYIDYNRDGVYNTFGDEKIIDTNGEVALPYSGINFTVPANQGLGRYILRVGTRQYFSSNDPCGNTGAAPEEFEDYVVEVIINPGSDRRASISGNSVGIEDESIITSTSNNTDFGTVDISSGRRQRTFTITNIGGGNLRLNNTPVRFVNPITPEFTIVSQPAGGTIIPSGGSANFVIEFDPNSVNSFTTKVNVRSNSRATGTNQYNFIIEGEGAQIYPDTDGDGVADNVDIDDDNDGITDTEEQNICLSNPLSTTADVIFLNETFGNGLTRITIDGATAGVTTSYCYEDGTTGQGPNECNNDPNLGDGKYTVHYSVTDNDGVLNRGTNLPDVSSWADRVWYFGEDHTSGDTNGRMAIFNADFDPGVFYETEIVGTVAGAPLDYSFWALNLDRLDSEFNSGELPRILPNISVNFYSIDKTILYQTFNAGDIPRCDSDPTNMCTISEWIQKTTSLTLPASDFVIQLVNNAPGGLGNDLALDDIRITQELCDLDGDGVADVVDLDNDNDGIPNIYELGKPGAIATIDVNLDGTSFGDGNWLDLNQNGMHDDYESFTPRDTDQDGVADYLDLDSDNDGIFDILEYDGLGDLDVNGDGIGDGTDASSGVDNDGFDGDGLLSLIDLNDDDADKVDHGTIGFMIPVDSDGDDIPDYIDIDSNDPLNDLTNGSDIDNSLYADLDTDNDGEVDFTSDIDQDGVSDGNSDFDTGFFGAPIDLDRDLFIDFDGRNDYVQNSMAITAGLDNLTAMTWIMLGDGFSSSTIISETNFNMRIRSTGIIEVTIKDNSGTLFNLESSSTLSINKWYHVSVIYNQNTSKTVLYINGIEEDMQNTGALPLETVADDKFTLGNKSDGTSDYFKGSIDELRIFNKALDTIVMRQMMYQEIEPSGSSIKGKVIDKVFNGLATSDLLLHYDFKKITADQVFNQGNVISNGTMYNIKSILPQSAPLPYETKQDGSLLNPTTFKQEGVWDPLDLQNFPYSILHVKNNVTQPMNMYNAGLIIDTGNTLIVNDGLEVNNTWYLKLDGTVDFLGESQLVQGENSELDLTSSGKILIRQEGISDARNYNYWSSPVGASSATSNNTSFQLSLLKDANGLGNVVFTGRNVATPPVTIPATVSGRWLYTYWNGQTYQDWNPIDAATPIPAGHGWTMKGAGAINPGYVFEGKPNNGSINVAAVDADGDPAADLTFSLLGNPYPSAIDARKFIDDNAGVIDGAVYLWDHFRGTDHLLANYEGGFMTINNTATLAATSIPIGSGALGGGLSGREPGFYIPVGQGFNVTITNNGSVNFNNGQREFKTEGAESVFVAAPGTSQPIADRSNRQNPDMGILRLEIEADNGAGSETVIGFADFVTDGIDYGYDAVKYDNPAETDIYISYSGKNYVIRSLAQITPNKVIPVTIHGKANLNYRFSAKEIANIDSSQDIFLYDNEMNVYHNLRNGYYFYNVSANRRNSSRFEIVFQQTTLGLDQEAIDLIDIYYLNNDGKIYVDHLNETLDYMNIYDLSGKMLFRFRESELININNGIYIPEISSGIYLVEVEFKGAKKSVKIVVN